MLELRALQGNIARLHAGRFELSLRLIDIRLWCDAAFKTIIRDAVCLFVVLHGVVQQLFLSIRAAGFEVVDGKFGLEAQHDGLTVACACLGLFPRGTYGSTNATPYINLVVEIDWKLDVAHPIAVGDRTVCIEIGAVRRLAKSSGEGRDSDRRIE
jgi:hypothetical protein